jgi:hypothetical protein
MAATQDKIRLLNDQISKLRTIETHYQATKNELKLAELEFEKLEENLNEEYADIESLEKLTLKGVFHSILGNKEKQLEIARQEYLTATLKYKAAKTTIQTLQFELKILKRKTQLLQDLEAELIGLHKIRENELKVEPSPQGESLRHILLEIDDQITYSNSLDLVKNSGKLALKKLSMAVLALQEAKNWGDWDMMSKRQKIGDYVKHSAIDDAKQFAFDAKRALLVFERELQEINMQLNTKQLEIGSLSSFLDVFFDNLITDWIFQQKIKKTLINLNEVIEDVKKSINAIDSNQENISLKLASLIESKESILSK